MIVRSHLKSSYRVINEPEQRILAAVVKQAVADIHSRSPVVRAEAQQFLADEEGQAWLSHFAGVPASAARDNQGVAGSGVGFGRVRDGARIKDQAAPITRPETQPVGNGDRASGQWLSSLLA